MDIVDSIKNDLVEIAQSATEIGQRANELYDKGSTDGYNKGYSDGKTEGIEQGKQAEYDAFWDKFQDYGNRTDYNNGFSGKGWTDITFQPKYDITSKKSSYMFQLSEISDLVSIFEKCGITFDFAGAPHINYLIYYSNITRVPEIDSTVLSGSQFMSVFANCPNLTEIVKFHLKTDGSQTFANTFQSCTSLEKVTFTGVIGKNGLNFQWSPNLSIESLRNIISCLKDYSTDTSGTVWKVTIGSTNYAKLTDDDLLEISQKGWQFV